MIYKRKYFAKFLLGLLLHCILANGMCYSQEDTSKKLLKNIPPDSGMKAADEKQKEERRRDSIESKRKSELPVVVQRVYNYNSKYVADEQLDSAGIGDIIVVEVGNLDSLLRQAKSNGQKISLFINGRKMDKIEPLSGAPDKDNGTLQYRLDRNSNNNQAWADILGAPRLLSAEFFIVDVKISVGLDNGYAIKTSTTENNFRLVRIQKGWFWVCSVIVLAYFIVVVFMARKSGLLRDRTIDLSVAGINSNNSLTPYSLGRFQMAFWFSLTVVSFFFIWLITGAYDIVTPTVLALIGISAGTSLSAAVIDNSKSSELLNQTVALQSEQTRLQVEVSSLNVQITTGALGVNIIELQNQKTLKESRLAEITPTISRYISVLSPQKSEGFLNDLLTDVNGVSFHRLQMLVWTFVLGLIFLYSVWKALSMPEFSATMLALQGLTAGTYLGFKFPEKQV